MMKDNRTDLHTGGDKILQGVLGSVNLSHNSDSKSLHLGNDLSVLADVSRDNVDLHLGLLLDGQLGGAHSDGGLDSTHRLGLGGVGVEALELLRGGGGRGAGGSLGKVDVDRVALGDLLDASSEVLAPIVKVNNVDLERGASDSLLLGSGLDLRLRGLLLLGLGSSRGGLSSFAGGSGLSVVAASSAGTLLRLALAGGSDGAGRAVIAVLLTGEGDAVAGDLEIGVITEESKDANSAGGISEGHSDLAVELGSKRSAAQRENKAVLQELVDVVEDLGGGHLGGGSRLGRGSFGGHDQRDFTHREKKCVEILGLFLTKK